MNNMVPGTGRVSSERLHRDVESHPKDSMIKLR